MKKIFLAALLSCCTAFLFSQQRTAPDTSGKPIQVFPDKINWTDSKPPLPPGARVAVLDGDPKKEGIFVMRLKFPPHYVVPPHTHPKDERVQVISGSVYVGLGDRVDEKTATHYTAGCYYMNPAGTHHYVYTGDEGATIQIMGTGPWGLNLLEEKKSAPSITR